MTEENANTSPEMDLNDGNCLGNGEQRDERDALGNSRLFHNEVHARMPVERNATHYNFNHKNRGLALIFNHETFEVTYPILNPRAGTNVDCECLVNRLDKLGFNVQVYHNLEVADVKARVAQAARYNHSDNDCFLMCVLSHGDLGVLYARDEAYKPESLWQPFAADVCPTLAGKPKMFFIQACQGDKLLPGVTLNRTETDGHPVATYRIPVHADFLIAYSTIPGFYSWRNTTRGSWFIQALCQELDENAYTYDILTILTFVSRRVAIDYESNTPGTPSMHEQKQIPCITSMLTRLVKFNNKGANALENEVAAQEVTVKEKSKSGIAGFFQNKVKFQSYQVNY